MRTSSLLLLFLGMLLTSVCDSRSLHRPSSARMLSKIDSITRQLRDLISSVEEYDADLKRTMSAVSPVDAPLQKRSSDTQLVSDLKRKRRLLRVMKNVFNNVQQTMDRQKKQANCNVLGDYKCDTEITNDIFLTYKYLSSPESPGKKRSFQQMLAGTAL